MKEQFIKDIDERLMRVELRLKALDKEKVELENEYRLLKELSTVYYKRGDYDTIEEERRVTAKVLDTSSKSSTPEKQVKMDYSRRGRIDYDEILELIFSDDNTPLTLGQIRKKVEELSGEKVNSGSIHSVVKRRVREGKLTYGPYVLGHKGKAETYSYVYNV